MWKLAIVLALAVFVHVEGVTKKTVGSEEFLRLVRKRFAVQEIPFTAPCIKQIVSNRVAICKWSYAVERFTPEGYILYHNSTRFKLSNGLEWRSLAGSQRSYSNLENLVENGTLIQNATQMAISCIKKPGSCDKVANGFNIYDTVAITLGPDDLWYESLNHWYSGVLAYNYTTKFKSNPATNAYTQMVWANTSSVGCVSLKYNQLKTKRPSRRIQVCAYDPPGNIEGQTIYKNTFPCDLCTFGCVKGTLTCQWHA